MHDRAIAWAASVLGSPILDVEPLHGGKTSTMLSLTDEAGGEAVLRLMTEEPWRSHGAALTSRERAAMRELATTGVPAPTSLGLDADGTVAAGPAHLMTRLPGRMVVPDRGPSIRLMAEMLASIHDVRPREPFRAYQSWAWEAKWSVPGWTQHPRSWQSAFDVLAQEPPAFAPTFLHRDFSHRNLLWTDDGISGVVDWVETSTGPRWLDAGHAATNLALAAGPEVAQDFLRSYSAVTGTTPEPYWLVMDAVGFLPAPGREPMFGAPAELAALDAWVDDLVRSGP